MSDQTLNIKPLKASEDADKSKYLGRTIEHIDVTKNSGIVPVVEGETAGEVARLLVRQAERLLEMALRLQAEVAEASVTTGPGGPARQNRSR